VLLLDFVSSGCHNTQQREGVAQRNHYAIEIDKERNYYTCRGFRHMARHYGNRGERVRIRNGRKLEYGQKGREKSNKYRDNLKEEENLGFLN